MSSSTSSTSAVLIIIHNDYAKSWPGILKLVQVFLGIINVSMVSYLYIQCTTSSIFFLLMAGTFLLCSFLLLLSCLVSISTPGFAHIVSKTIFEFLYHAVAFVLYLAASLTLLLEDTLSGRRTRCFEEFITLVIIGLVTAALYLISTIFSYRSFKGC